MKIKLPSGATGFFNDQRQWICTGSQMGRRNTKPSDLPEGDWQPGAKLRLVKLPFTDGCYDQGGAYWGGPANIYMATQGAVTYSPLGNRWELIPCGVTIYVRADSRQEAKQDVLAIVPDAKFYR